MHLTKCQYFVFLLFIFWPEAILCQRRIVNGHTTVANATFVVYLLSGEPAKVNYEGWLCGGAIVSRYFVLTSAACLEDVQYMYVIAGYDKYVSADRIEEDDCIMNTRKRVGSWCRQMDFTLGDSQKSGEEAHKWSYQDIALAMVEEPFDFKDPQYLQYCSYLPSIIPVSVSTRLKHTNMPVVAYGWGHRKYFRPTGDNTNYNSEGLYYASSRIIDEKDCEDIFQSDYIKQTIKHYGLCTSGTGYLNDEGRITNLMDDLKADCVNECGRRNILPSRRQGICQNDHGGPLVAWYGGRPFVIGVASFFRLTEKRMCTSPFVYTSTKCVEKMMMCVLSRTRRTDLCAQQNNISIVESYVVWPGKNTETTIPITTDTVMETLVKQKVMNTAMESLVTQNTTMETLDTQELTKDTTMVTLDTQNATVDTAIETLDTQKLTKDTAMETIDIKKLTMDPAMETLDTQKLTMDTAVETLDTQKLTMNTALRTLDTQKLTMDEAMETLDTQKLTIDTAMETLDTHKLTMNTALRTLDTQKLSMDTAMETLDTQKLNMDTAMETLDIHKLTMDTTSETLDTQKLTTEKAHHYSTEELLDMFDYEYF